MKTAIVTGGTRGIGKAVVEQLLQEGYGIGFTYRSNHPLAEELVARYGPERILGRSLGDAREETLAFVKDVQGLSSRIDLLVMNAGVIQDNLFATMTEAEWLSVHQTNLLESFNLLQSVVKVMIYQKGGSIIFMSSVAGFGGEPGQSNYSSSKGAINAFAKTLARELGRYHIRVNTVSPGCIETDMLKRVDSTRVREMARGIPLGRLGKASEVASLVSFLASDQAAYVHGANLVIDGGLT